MQPPPELLDAFGLADATISDAGGATGRLWRVSTPERVVALRLAISEESGRAQEAATIAATAGGVPAPELIGYETTPAGVGLLQAWMPGTMVSTALFRDSGRARRIGQACGEVQWKLHGITAPVEVEARRRRWAEPPFDPLPAGQALLHLDFHPNNILIDDSGAVCGVLDWENAAVGDPRLDLARTRSIMTLDPFVASLTPAARHAADEFTAGWSEGYGDAEVPADYQLWAARVMLRDINHRHEAGTLAPLRARIESLAAQGNSAR